MYFCICRRRGDDSPVLNGLCYTPAQLYEKSQKGIPIASQQVPDDHFDEGQVGENVPVEIQYRRGVDINDLWYEEQKVKHRMRDAVKEAQRLQKVSQSLSE